MDIVTIHGTTGRQSPTVVHQWWTEAAAAEAFVAPQSVVIGLEECRTLINNNVLRQLYQPNRYGHELGQFPVERWLALCGPRTSGRRTLIMSVARAHRLRLVWIDHRPPLLGNMLQRAAEAVAAPLTDGETGVLLVFRGASWSGWFHRNNVEFHNELRHALYTETAAAGHAWWTIAMVDEAPATLDPMFRGAVAWPIVDKQRLVLLTRFIGALWIRLDIQSGNVDDGDLLTLSLAPSVNCTAGELHTYCCRVFTMLISELPDAADGRPPRPPTYLDFTAALVPDRRVVPAHLAGERYTAYPQQRS